MKILASLAIVFIFSGLAGCNSGAGMEPTITLERANQRVEQYIDQARTSLPAGVELELQESFEDYPCTDPDDGGPEGRRIASRTFQVMGPAKTDIPQYFDAVLQWSKQNGFVVLKHEPTNEYLWMENRSDGFRVSLEANSKGELYVGATSPCVWPEGTPQPQ